MGIEFRISQYNFREWVAESIGPHALTLRNETMLSPEYSSVIAYVYLHNVRSGTPTTAAPAGLVLRVVLPGSAETEVCGIFLTSANVYDEKILILPLQLFLPRRTLVRIYSFDNSTGGTVSYYARYFYYSYV